MLERQLTRLIREAGHRTNGPNPLPWAIIYLLATVAHRSLTADVSEIHNVRLREGDEVTISLRERDD